MTKPLCFFACLMIFTVNAADKVFHRLIVVNDARQILVVKIKGTDLWVTPGLYSESSSLTDEMAQALSDEYGLTTTQPVLRGQFIVEFKSEQPASSRYFYMVQKQEGELQLPETIETALWLELDQAVEKINLPHINLLMTQVLTHSDDVWAGTVQRFKQDGEFKATLTEDFYSLGKGR